MLLRPLVLFLVYAGSVCLSAQTGKSTSWTPVSDEVNSTLPAWLRFGGEERIRMEYINGTGFKSVEDLYLLQRLRLRMDVSPVPWLRMSFEAQDSRVYGQNTQPAPASQKDILDLRVGYVRIGEEEGKVVLRAGRQRLDFGDGRLLADPNWSNVGRTFDAARLTLGNSLYKVDLFSGAVVKASQLDFNEPAPGSHFHGAYGSLRGLIPGATLEPYLFWRLEHNYKSERGRLGNMDEKTVGLRWTGKAPMGFDYTGEVAIQRGDLAGDAIHAWTGRWMVAHALPHRMRAFVEYARASGDQDSKDGRWGTFDPLFPSSHDKYGLTDLFGSSNMSYFRPGLQFTVRRGLVLATAYNDLWLASATDGLYVGGKSVARSVQGTAGTHIGREADFQAVWTVKGTTQFVAGYGRLFPGSFLKNTTSGMPYNIAFCGVTQRF